MRRGLGAALAAVLLGSAPADSPRIPAETESLTEGLRPFELVADWAERAGAIALGSRAASDDLSLLADLGLEPRALGPTLLAAELRARALDLAWRVVEHPECDPVLRSRAEGRIRALLPKVPPNRDESKAATFLALVVIARASEWVYPRGNESAGGASRARFDDDEIDRLRADLSQSSSRVFEWSRGVLRLDLTIRVVEGAPFDGFARSASREYDRVGVLPDLSAESTRRRFLDSEAAARDGFHGAYLFVKYEGTVEGKPIPSPSDGHGGAMRVAAGGASAVSPSVRHIAYGTLQYRSRAAAWFGRTGFLHEWYHGLHDLADLKAPRGASFPDNHSVWLHSRDGREERLLSDDDPDFYRVVLGECFSPRLLRAVVGDR